MRAELPAFSFLSVVFILLILPGQLKSNNIPAVSIIAWLFVCNLIHGVNAILWANNVDIRASAWCDLAVTAVLLGAMVAVPGAFLCVARQLDLMTTRTDTGLKPEQRHKKPFEILMCIVLPVVYIALRNFFPTSLTPSLR
ncbi:fungal pheromone STE3G-protein-coupled receptor [Auriscalpium vulgare]|uniref:Fungal pheromone STE3G-protein-coupled receptor n=1 Tax=Auriscalpium vulgare TaxID=40419 RepID=A0ACB8SC12_9AGAM|nr:fungal pheromone STE3G-protein-coupled receptor [Auriscalpium vulgare]